MKRQYSKPITCCLQIKVGSGLLQSSIATSEQRQTSESFSRQQQPLRNYDVWDDEEEESDEDS